MFNRELLEDAVDHLKELESAMRGEQSISLIRQELIGVIDKLEDFQSAGDSPQSHWEKAERLFQAGIVLGNLALTVMHLMGLWV